MPTEARPHRIAVYTLTGALAGAASHGIGALMLRPGDPDHFKPGAAALAGFVGGASTHVVLGALAGCAPKQSLCQELYALGANAIVATVTAGVVGGALLGLGGHHDQPTTGRLVLAGLLGTAVLSVGGAAVAVVFCACGVALWAGDETGHFAYRLLRGRRDLAAEEV